MLRWPHLGVIHTLWVHFSNKLKEGVPHQWMNVVGPKVEGIELPLQYAEDKFHYPINQNIFRLFDKGKHHPPSLSDHVIGCDCTDLLC